MRIGSIRYVALATAAGMWMFFTMPAHATCSSMDCIKAHEENIKTLSKVTSMGAPMAPRKHSDTLRKARKRYAHKAAPRTTAKKSTNPAIASAEEKRSLALEVANARAELQGLNVQPQDHANIADITGMPSMDGTQIAMSDQLNDADRSLNTEAHPIAKPETPILQIVKAIPITGAPAVTNRDDDTWSKTSMIGQIFIALGGLLAMGSAARMLSA